MLADGSLDLGGEVKGKDAGVEIAQDAVAVERRRLVLELDIPEDRDEPSMEVERKRPMEASARGVSLTDENVVDNRERIRVGAVGHRAVPQARHVLSLRVAALVQRSRKLCVPLAARLRRRPD